MFGCLGRLGCLVVLVVLVAGAYITRGRWMPKVWPGNKAPAAVVWAPLSKDGVTRARRGVSSLDRADGPAYVNVRASDFVSYLVDPLPSTAAGQRVEASTERDQLKLRTSFRVADLGVEDVPLLGTLRDKTVDVTVGGTLAVGKPGVGEWHVQSIVVDAISLPGPAVRRATRAVAAKFGKSVGDNGVVQFPIAPRIADIRVRGDTITLYKAAR